MNIAFVSSLFKPTNSQAKGGQEMWAVNFLNEELNHPHTIDLYSINNSLNHPPQINLIQILDKGMDEIRSNKYFQTSISKEKDITKFNASIYAKTAVMLKTKESTYDFVIDSTGEPTLPMVWEEFNIPLIVIGHFPVSKQYASFFSFHKLPNNVFYIFPSEYQKKEAYMIPNEQKIVIPHGIHTDQFSDTYIDGQSMFWYGRIDPKTPKGVVEAIKVANTLETDLEIFPYIENESYFNEEVKPLLSSYTTINLDSQRSNILANKKLFLFPIQWEEPFGLVFVEALASGNPVVTFARGAAPEIVKDGKTGFIVNPSDNDIRGDFIIKKTGIEGLCEAVKRIYAMSNSEYLEMRKACRTYAEANFSISEMVNKYEALYKKITNIQ